MIDLAEVIADKWARVVPGADIYRVDGGLTPEQQNTKATIKSAIQETIRECVKVINRYAEECNNEEPGQHAKSACFFVEQKLLELIGEAMLCDRRVSR